MNIIKINKIISNLKDEELISLCIKDYISGKVYKTGIAGLTTMNIKDIYQYIKMLMDLQD